MEYPKCQPEMKDKRYIGNRWGAFSFSGFGLIFPSEGTANANKYNTILSDYFHPLETFKPAFSSSKMTESIFTGHKNLLNSLMSLINNVNLTPEPAEH